MVELAYFWILGTQVWMKVFQPWPQQPVQVPTEIVRHCADFTLLDPYDYQMKEIDQMRLYDCYLFRMGEYE